jgi:hypothetical protein
VVEEVTPALERVQDLAALELVDKVLLAERVRQTILITGMVEEVVERRKLAGTPRHPQVTHSAVAVSPLQLQVLLSIALAVVEVAML